MLSEEQLKEYDETGVLIVESLFSPEENDEIRDSMHEQLLNYGIDHDQILNRSLECTESIRKKSKVSRIFYSKWKIDGHINDRIYSIMKQLLVSTYGSANEDYSHPFGKFDDVIPYIDRICWRLPDSIRAEGGLGMHLDRNPYDPYLLKTKTGLTKWRPIQAILVLTDHWGTDTGGLQVVQGFHKEIDNYFSLQTGLPQSNSQPMEAGGEFFRMNAKNHAKLEKRLQPVNAPKGSLICWDNRLPHATTQFLSGNDTRECIYIGYLPRVSLNITYQQLQFKNIVKNIPPPAYLEKDNETSDRDWNVENLSDLQKRLLGF
jgi:hypothetical protein